MNGQFFYTDNVQYPTNLAYYPRSNKTYIQYGNSVFLQGLHPVKGPVMYPLANGYSNTNNFLPAYPTTSSVLNPYLRSYTCCGYKFNY